MILEVLDPKTMTFEYVAKNADDLFCIIAGTLHKYHMLSIGDCGFGIFNEEVKDSDSYILVRITDTEPEIKIEESAPEEIVITTETSIRQTREFLTYKLFSNDPTESIFVEFRPTGDIRVNFKDKESAQAYFEYFREQFYTSTTGASVITVSNIYKDLNLVNWNPEDCDDWGWYTIDNGHCRYISEVLKTRNSKMYGFTLKKPRKLYESKKREA